MESDPIRERLDEFDREARDWCDTTCSSLALSAALRAVLDLKNTPTAADDDGYEQGLDDGYGLALKHVHKAIGRILGVLPHGE
jgi:hypothetical protein